MCESVCNLAERVVSASWGVQGSGLCVGVCGGIADGEMMDFRATEKVG